MPGACGHGTADAKREAWRDFGDRVLTKADRSGPGSCDAGLMTDAPSETELWLVALSAISGLHWAMIGAGMIVLR